VHIKKLLPWVLPQLALSSAIMIVGCSGAESDESGQTVATGSEALSAGQIMVNGMVFAPVNTSTVVANQAKAVGDGGANGPEDFSTLTVDELAERFRPMLGRDGKLYQAVTPNYAAANALKSATVLGAGQSPSFNPQAGKTSEADYLFNPSNPGNPENTDYRTADGSGWPYSTLVYLQSHANGSNTIAQCTGTYVGAHTLITAAHCLRLNGVSYGQNIVFTPAATGTNGNVTSAPYGSYTNNNNGQCYDWWYPSAWDSSGNSDQYDYAAVDFRRCGNPTINNTGWMGTYVNQNSFPSTHLDGYPASYNVNNNEPSSPGSTPPCGRNNNPSGFYPFLCGMSGPANIQPNKSYAVESDTLNSSDGMSGGPWWFWLNGNDPRVQGVTHGWENYFDFTQCGFNNCNRNYAHLIDTAYWNFLTQVTEL
jgi:V8-like Glu-specific endopeptidase